ncbi:uncharacterized protein LOC128309540 [Anopheles moucheti]|uniref:uncharacterized protein LOC128309540 n=1 Tax=Anopheles moucheti TaxID=186751 RepID=UPI0022F09F04|nr:uncharacterized protein LOC128309540 [Anopheles moucheti]
MSFRTFTSPVVRRFLEANNRKVMQQRFAATRNHYSDLRGFTIADIKKNYAVVPLVVIMATAVIGCTGFIIYASFTRVDVSLNKKVFPHDTMDVMNPPKKKILVYNQKYEPNPELNQALSYREEYEKLDK